MRKLLYAAVMSGLATSPAAAADWHLTATGQDGIKIYVDAESIVTIANARYTWEKRYYSKAADGSVESTVRREWDCTDRKQVLMSAATYTAGGRVIDSWTTPAAELAWHEIFPDTVDEAILRYVCSLAPRP